MAMLFAVACCIRVSSADEVPVFRVDGGNKTGTATGLTWTDSFAGIQEGIDAAFNAGGGEVWVKAGVYKPDGDGRDASFELKPGVRLYGAFRGTETQRDERNLKANRTTLSGDLGTIGNESDNCYHILTGATDTRIDGFIISRGNANGLKQKGTGGGIAIPEGSRKIVIANCTFEKNSAGWQGGAIYGKRIELTVTNCAFFSNAAVNGGGLAIGGTSSLTLTDTVFSANLGQTAGGAINLENETSAAIEDCRFALNSTGGNGGSMFVSVDNDADVSITISRCTFSGGKAEGTGGAVFMEGGFSAMLQQCSFTRNTGFKGTGGVVLQGGTQAVAQNCTYKQNRGDPAIRDLFCDETSNIFDSMEALQASQEPEETIETKEPLRMLADVQVYGPQHKKVPLRSIVSHKPYTVLVLGDLTDPVFIENYRNIEAIASDYKAMDIQFFYIYRALTHPENNGYLQPYILKERTKQVQQAKSLLSTTPTWLYDGMDNQTLKALADGNDAYVFIYSADGGEWYRGSLEDADSIRSAITELAGAAPTITEPSRFHSPKIPSKDVGKSDLLDRIHFEPGTEPFSPLRITPQSSRIPYYVKLRAEGDDDLLESGNGRLYLGFHIDPLYRMQWDNSADPLEYEIQVPAGLAAPRLDNAPEIKIQPYDTEPREFVLTARQLDLSKPLQLRVHFSIYSTDLDKSVEVSQVYSIHLERDPFGGKAYRRQIAHSDPPRKNRAPMPTSLRHLDINNDGKLSRAELTGNLWSKFPQMDTNNDGYLSEDEYNAYLRNR